MCIIWLKSVYTGFTQEIKAKNKEKNQVLKKFFLSKIFEIFFAQNVTMGPFWRFSMIFDPQNMDFESLSNLKFPCQKPPFSQYSLQAPVEPNYLSKSLKWWWFSKSSWNFGSDSYLRYFDCSIRKKVTRVCSFTYFLIFGHFWKILHF